jgi:hypothetical protein
VELSKQEVVTNKKRTNHMKWYLTAQQKAEVRELHMAEIEEQTQGLEHHRAPALEGFHKG